MKYEDGSCQKNYETVSKISNVMPIILWLLFSGHGVRLRSPKLSIRINAVATNGRITKSVLLLTSCIFSTLKTTATHVHSAHRNIYNDLVMILIASNMAPMANKICRPPLKSCDLDF